ncbi:hypothetical protein M4951_17435 [Blastopirellula sp. J2-11]|uniref:hypothetical protein n=1 Tax=Blastopirellula sp. J2-11 TaxID=2943192 RepID=UPI0021C7148D|nr:hypothetical protein [Blastopirellula sp. J2-11]UUO05158.1 hypothetical protein M4951_17435 [Blastopirellula sp. J2-11]
MVRWKIVLVCQTLFVALFALCAPWVLYAIGPDGTAYVQQADFFARGDLWQAASGYWSPLLSILSAPMIAAGLDPVVGFRIAQGIVGVSYVAAAIGATTHIFELKTRGQWVVGLIATLTCVAWSCALTTPDVAIALFLLLYFPLSASNRLLTDWRYAAAAGALGAVAFLAKAYAFPFFLAHFTFCVAIRYFTDRKETAFWKACAGWGVGVLVFAIVAGPWIGILSSKYGRFTFSNSGAFNHYQVGIEDFDWHVLYKLQSPVEGRINVWETPEKLEFEDWSPISSTENVMRQLRHFKSNARKIVEGFWVFDVFGLFPAALFLVWLSALVHGPVRARFLVVWMILTCGIYAGGFMPVAFEIRYMWPVLMPLCIAQLWAFCEQLIAVNPQSDQQPSPWRRFVPLGFAIYLVCSCSLRPSFYLLRDAISERASGRVQHRLGNQLQAEQIQGPIAMIGDRWQDGLLVSYYAKQPYLGKTFAADWTAAQQDFEDFGVQTLIVDSREPLSDEMPNHSEWRLVATTPVLDYELRTYRKTQDQ